MVLRYSFVIVEFWSQIVKKNPIAFKQLFENRIFFTDKFIFNGFDFFRSFFFEFAVFARFSIPEFAVKRWPVS